MKNLELKCPDCGLLLCPDFSDHGVEHRHPSASDIEDRKDDCPALYEMYLRCSNSGKLFRRSIGELEIVP
jgi:hypothetical protein